MSAEASRLLKTVAQSFLDQDRPLQAIRCLEALCLASRTDYPEQEAGLHCEVRMAGSTARNTASIGEFKGWSLRMLPLSF